MALRDPLRCGGGSAARNRALPRALCLLALGLGLSVGLTVPGLARGRAPRVQTPETMRSVRAGVYTTAQGERGARLYEASCLNCHAAEQFVGPTYMNSWTDQTAQALFDVLRETMPQDNPGSLRRQQYADLLAYLFALNGMPAGDTELKGTDSALKNVRIEGPYRHTPGHAPVVNSRDETRRRP